MVNKHFTKFRKGRIKGIIRPGTEATYGLNFGDYGLIATEKVKVRKEALEAGRKVIMKEMDKAGKLWIGVYPDIAITTKGISVRMGKGKGSISHHVARVREGMVVYEVTGVEEHIAREAFKQAATKLGFNTKVIVRPKVLKPDPLYF